MAISLEHQIRNILEGRSKGTLEREKVQNVARPDSEPSKHAKTEEIQKKIIDEGMSKAELAALAAAATAGKAVTKVAAGTVTVDKKDWKKAVRGETIVRGGEAKQVDAKALAPSSTFKGTYAGRKFQKEELDVPTPSPSELAKKWHMSLAAVRKGIKAGQDVEKEHTTDDEKAAEIAADHLKERPDYYKKLAKMERGAVTKEEVENVEEGWASVGPGPAYDWAGDVNKKVKFYGGKPKQPGGGGEPGTDWAKSSKKPSKTRFVKTVKEEAIKKALAKKKGSTIIDKNPKTKDEKPDDFVAEASNALGPLGSNMLKTVTSNLKHKFGYPHTGSFADYKAKGGSTVSSQGPAVGTNSSDTRAHVGGVTIDPRGEDPRGKNSQEIQNTIASGGKGAPPSWGLRSAIAKTPEPTTTPKSTTTTTPKGIGISSAQAAPVTPKGPETPLPPVRPTDTNTVAPTNNPGDTYADGRNKSDFQAAYNKARELGGSKAQFDFGGKSYQAAADKSEYVPTSQQKRVDIGDLSKNSANTSPDTADKAGAPPKRPTDLNTESGKGKKKMSEENNPLISAFLKLQGMVNENRFEAVKKLAEEKSSAYSLHAEHAETNKKIHLGDFSSPEEAQQHIEKLEQSNQFPEGHEAVLTNNSTGKRQFFTDKWEDLEEETQLYNEDRDSVSAEENLDEISKKTLGNYVKKASQDRVDTMSDWHDAALKGPTRGEFPNGPNWWKPFLTKIDKRKRGIEKAVNKLTKEEHQLDELSPGTLRSYKEKARDSYDGAKWRSDNANSIGKKDDKTLAKRSEGLKRANNRLYNEGREDISGEEAFKSPQSRREAKYTYSKPNFKYKEPEKDVYGVIGSKEREKAMAAAAKAKKKNVKEESQLDEISRKLAGSYLFHSRGDDERYAQDSKYFSDKADERFKISKNKSLSQRTRNKHAAASADLEKYANDLERISTNRDIGFQRALGKLSREKPVKHRQRFNPSAVRVLAKEEIGFSDAEIAHFTQVMNTEE